MLIKKKKTQEFSLLDYYGCSCLENIGKYMLFVWQLCLLFFLGGTSSIWQRLFFPGTLRIPNIPRVLKACEDP